MRDDPYPARFYGRQVDEPFLGEMLFTTPQNTETVVVPFRQPLSRIFLLLMTLYLGCALFLIFTVSSYAAPLGSATISSYDAASCLETVAAR